jgi:hypothetical protein
MSINRVPVIIIAPTIKAYQIIEFWILKYLYLKTIIPQTIDHNRYSKIHLTWNTIYQNGYNNYRQVFFTNLENTFSFLTLTAKIKQYDMIITKKKSKQIIEKWILFHFEG